MKLLHFADIHIGMENYSKLDPKTGLSTRLLDFLATFDFIVDTAIKEDCDALILPTKPAIPIQLSSAALASG